VFSPGGRSRAPWPQLPVGPGGRRVLRAPLHTLCDDRGATAAPRDFFISYRDPDLKWASWIAWELEAQGFKTIVAAWDFRRGENFVSAMQDASIEARCTLALVSRAYLDGTRYTTDARTPPG
jgi:hypothetical protein